jgi:hypothetical protein
MMKLERGRANRRLIPATFLPSKLLRRRTSLSLSLFLVSIFASVHREIKSEGIYIGVFFRSRGVHSYQKEAKGATRIQVAPPRGPGSCSCGGPYLWPPWSYGPLFLRELLEFSQKLISEKEWVLLTSERFLKQKKNTKNVVSCSADLNTK